MNVNDDEAGASAAPLAARRTFICAIAAIGSALTIGTSLHVASATPTAPTSSFQKDSLMTSDDMRAKWELYAKAWSAQNDADRNRILNEVLSADFTYLDPRISCRTHAEVAANVKAFQERQPGGSFALRDILTHHDVAMVNWQLIQADGAATNRGYDIVRFTDAGQFAGITAFFAKPTSS
jgi:hypothetical protein